LSMQTKKALAMFTRYSIKCGGFPVKVAFQLFDKTISPILLYGAEIWGYKQYKVLEDVHIKFCKKILGLPKQASNNAVMGECGRFPLVISCQKKCVAYWLKILEMPCTRYVKNCYLMLKRLDENGKKTWASSVKELLFKYGYGIVWMEQGVGDKRAFLCNFMDRLRDCNFQEWHHDIHNSSKLSVYCTFKSMLEAEKYLDYVDIWKYRVAVTRFRISCHNLEIEKGRHDGVLMENRLCRYCEEIGNFVIEDEFHFLICCPLYVEIRSKYNIVHVDMPRYEQFIEIMESEDKQTIIDLALYIFNANKVRNEFLN